MLLFAAFASLAFSACNKENDDDCEASATPDMRACYEIYAPVCGCNNVTYSNDCVAESYGISVYTSGACR